MSSGLSQSDIAYMRRALVLAEKGQYTTRPNPAVGCVIVKDDRIIAESYHRRAGTAHAEILALEQAGLKAEDATCYITLEPCSHWGKTGPCTKALIKAGVKRVVVAMADPNPLVNGDGIRALQEAGIEVSIGVLQEDAESLNQGFCHSMRHKLPFVRLKTATSLDGRTAMKNGESAWISCEESRLNVQTLRARSGALISGIGTILSDNSLLNVRPEGWYEGDETIPQPIRVIVDSELKIPLDAKLFTVPSEIWIVCAKPDTQKMQQLIEKGVKVLILPNAQGQVDLLALLKKLHGQGIRDVLIEAGNRLSGAFVSQKLVNEIWIYMAPILMGDSAKGLFHIDIANMTDKIALTVKDLRMVGKNWRWILTQRS